MGGSGRSIRYTMPTPKKEPSSGVGSDSSEADCDKIFFNDEVQNLKTSIKDYKIHDVLNVQLGSNEKIEVIGEYGLVGNLASVDAIELIDCIKLGKKFKAAIFEISENNCKVTVRPLR